MEEDAEQERGQIMKEENYCQVGGKGWKGRCGCSGQASGSSALLGLAGLNVDAFTCQ